MTTNELLIICLLVAGTLGACEQSVNDADVRSRIYDDLDEDEVQHEEPIDSSGTPEPMTNMCEHLRLFHEELQWRRIKSLREHILSSLNLRKPPRNVTRPSESMLAKIRDSQEQMQRDSSWILTNARSNRGPPVRLHAKQQTMAEVKKKVIFGTKDVPDKNLTAEPKRTYFHISNMHEYEVRNATLYFHVHEPRQANGESDFEFTVHVYRFTDGSRIITEPTIQKTFKDDLKGGHWIPLDVTELVYEWVKTPRKNYGVMLSALFNGEDLINRTTDESNRTSQIFLHIEFNEETSRRVVQHVHEDPICSPDQLEEKCCRYQLQVDFEAMGWDWIIAPKRYDAFYCAGTCPFNYKQSSPHTHLTQQMESLLPRTHRIRSIGPCCMPKEYQDLKIIYVSEAGTVHERRVPDMMVLRCGCA